MIGIDYGRVSGYAPVINARHVNGPLSKKSQEIEHNKGWHGSLSGVNCEKILRGQQNGVYLIRHGEEPNTYYISWVEDTEQCFFRHQPFKLISDGDTSQWLYANGYDKLSEALEDLIPLMMHRPKENCHPIAQ